MLLKFLETSADMATTPKFQIRSQENPKGFHVAGAGVGFFLYALKRVSPETGRFIYYLECDCVCMMDDPADQRFLVVQLGEQKTLSVDILQTKITQAFMRLFADKYST